MSMNLSQMLSNPQLGGKVLFGGDGDNTQKMIIGGIVILIVLCLMGCCVWVWCKEPFDTQFQGVGPSASHIPGEGTFGYAQALTYQEQREAQELAEHQVLKRQREKDVQKAARERRKEGFVDDLLMLNEDFDDDDLLELEPYIDSGYTDPEDTLGTPSALPENFADVRCPLDDTLADGGVHAVLRRTGRVPYATGQGAQSHAIWQLQKAGKMCKKHDESRIENMAAVPAFVDMSKTGSVAANPLEPYSNIKLPRRNTYRRRRENFEGTTTALDPIVDKLGGQGESPNIGWLPTFGFDDPTQVNLAGKLRKPREQFGLNLYHKKKGNEVTGYYTPSGGYTSSRGGAGRLPYTSDKAQFLTLFKKNKDANVVESDCDEHGRCKISFVGNPKNLGGELADLVGQLSKSERNQLLSLSSRYSRYQLNARERIRSLVRKRQMSKNNKNVIFTANDAKELKNLEELMKTSGSDIDRYNRLVEKSALRLSSKQYIVPGQTPSNACQVKKGLRYYGPDGKLQRLTHYVPSNSCDYSDLRDLKRRRQNLAGMTKGDVKKIADAVKRISKK